MLMAAVTSRARKLKKAINNKQHLRYCRELEYLLGAKPTSKDDLELWTKSTSKAIQKAIIDQVTSQEIAYFITGLLANKNCAGLTPKACQESFVTLFEETNGAAQELAHKILFSTETEAWTESNASNSENNLFKDASSLTKQEKVETLNSLHANGYAIFPLQIKKEFLDQLLDAISKLRFTKDSARGSEGELIDLSNPPDCNVSHAAEKDLHKAKIIRTICENNLLKNLAEEYMQASVIPIDKNLWYTFPSKSPSSEAAQLFHYDIDSLRWIKVFIYLSNVAEENGPHEYVRGTHKVGSRNLELLTRRYSRITDKEIKTHYKGRNQKIFGDKGTIIFADTRCYHKGNNPTIGHRLMLEFTFAPSTIGFNIA